MKSSQIPLVLMSCGLLLLAACANAPKQIALDYGPVQIGYCLQLDDACAGTYAPKSDRTASPNLRIGLPFWIQPEYGYDVNGLNLALLAGAGPGRGFKGVAAAPVFLAEQGRGFVIAPLASVVAKLDGLSVGIFNWVWDGQSIQLGLVNLRNGIVTWPDWHRPNRSRQLRQPRRQLPIWRGQCLRTGDTISTGRTGQFRPRGLAG